jgi:hypothetical protein
MAFARTQYSTELVGQGIMELSSDAGSGLGPIRLQFDGRAQPKEGLFIGKAGKKDFRVDLDTSMEMVSAGFYEILSSTVLSAAPTMFGRGGN